MNTRQTIVAIGTFMVLAIAQSAFAQEPARPYDKSFLANYDLLMPRAAPAGQPGDLAYVAANALERVAAARSVMVDQPEILFSPDSDIKGMKPDDLSTLAEAIRDAVSGKLAEGGYSVSQQPGPGVLYLRIGLTDLMLKKKKRGLLAYTPVGAVVKAGTDAVKETLSKVDFIEMTFQAELVDSVSNDVLGAIVAERGTRKAKGQDETRIDIDEFNQNMGAWGNRLRCQLDNSRAPADQQHDCVDDAGNAVRYDARPQ